MRKITGLVAVITLALTMGASATLIWSGAVDGNSGNVDNWLDDVTGLAPTESPTGPMTQIYAGGLSITDGTLTGQIDPGSNAVVFTTSSINTGGNGVDGLGFPALVLNDSMYSGQWCAQVAITLAGNSTMWLNGGGGPLGNGAIHATVDFTSETAILQFQNENAAAFINEHKAFISVNGVAAVWGTDEFLAEPGDTALASAFNGTAGTQVMAIPEPATLGMVALFGGGILFVRRKFRN